MEITKPKAEWKQQFLDNYEGRSNESKELGDFRKKTYKNMDYIPWATMERLMYMQDPEAEIEVIHNDDEYGGSRYVFPNDIVNITVIDGKETRVTMFSHVVVVRVKFLGKVVEEIMPVQDQKYEAVKTIDQNLVNKSIQRAKTKACARVTGLALRFYEGFDLQYDETKPTEPIKDIPLTKEPPAVPEPAPADPEPVKAPKTPETAPVIDGDKADYLTEIANKIHGNKEIEVGLQRINVSILKKLGFVINLDDDIPTLVEKLSKLSDAKVTYKAILKQSGKVE